MGKNAIGQTVMHYGHLYKIIDVLKDGWFFLEDAKGSRCVAPYTELRVVMKGGD